MSRLTSFKGAKSICAVVLALALLVAGTAATVLAAPDAQAQNPVGEISGQATPGDTIRVTQGDTVIGETVAGPDGVWRLALPRPVAAQIPYRVQIAPTAERGAAEPTGEPVLVIVMVTIGNSKVEVRVQVISPNGQIDIEILAPIDPITCGNGAPAGNQPGGNGATYHTVKSGETLAIIGARYGVSAQAIATANRLRNANIIYVGQRLLIPAR